MNIVIIKGRLTADPEMRTANSGMNICNFSVAVDRRPDKDGNKKTDFIRCCAFGKTAEFLGRYFSKGKELIAEGTIQQNDYTDKDGVKHNTYQVLVNQVHFCGGKNEQAQANTGTYNNPELEQFAKDVETIEPGKEVPF